MWQIISSSRTQILEKTSVNVNSELLLFSTASFHYTCAKTIYAVKFTTVTLDKVLNVLIYASLRFDKIQYVGEHIKWT